MFTTFYRGAVLGSYVGYAGKLMPRYRSSPPAVVGGAHQSGGSDERVWSTLGTRNSPITLYARALTRNTAKADDLLQRSLVRALEKQHLWQPGGTVNLAGLVALARTDRGE
jgi:hypothetical protein